MPISISISISISMVPYLHLCSYNTALEPKFCLQTLCCTSYRPVYAGRRCASADMMSLVVSVVLVCTGDWARGFEGGFLVRTVTSIR